jgi:hypothetical protein
MNRIRHLANVLGGLAANVLVLGSAPAFAERVPRPAAGATRPTGRSTSPPGTQPRSAGCPAGRSPSSQPRLRWPPPPSA